MEKYYCLIYQLVGSIEGVLPLQTMCEES